MTDPLGHAVRHSRDGAATEAVPDQDHVMQILPGKDIADVIDKGVERDGLGEQVRAFPTSGLGGRVHHMPERAQAF